MKIAFFDTKPYEEQVFRERIQDTPLKIKFCESKLNEDNTILAKGCIAVCVFVNDNINSSVIDKLYDYGVQIIALRCAGFNNVDIKYANNKGIKVVRVPAYSPNAIAEFAMSLLLTLNRKTHKAYIRTRDFNFSLNGLTGFDLYGKTIGIIGTGKIGRVFIDICNGFGMNVICYDKYPIENSKYNYKSLDYILRNSDIISFHCPLTSETKHIINNETIKNLQKGVIIINTSRGALIDSEALLTGIKDKTIGGACLDVYEEEASLFYQDKSAEIIEDDTLSRLISMPNVIVSSHQAFLTNEALDNIATTTIQNIIDVATNNECANLVTL